MPLPLPAWLPAAGAVVAAYAALRSTGYWLVPILVHRKPHCASATPTRFTPVEEVGALDRGMQMGINRMGFQLAELGFAPTPPMRDASGKLKGVVQLHQQAADGNVASIIVMPRPVEEDGFVSLFFTSETTDGTRVVTTNAPLPGVYPPRPGVRAARFPGETDARRLYALHKAHVRSIGPTKPVTLDDPGTWQALEEERSIQWWIECGYCVRAGDVLRHTWKGACCTVWRLQAPWKTRLETQQEKLRQELLAGAGLA